MVIVLWHSFVSTVSDLADFFAFFRLNCCVMILLPCVCVQAESRSSVEFNFAVGYTEIPFSDLRFDTQIGAGGFGSVWKGQWISHAETVAIKLLHAQNFTDSVMKEFRAELEMMFALRSRYIIGFIGVCLEPGKFCLVMELAERSLFDLLHGKTKPTWRERVMLASELARGLLLLHQHSPQILHRDVKSLNVLILDGHAKLSDFGMAKAKLETATTTKIAGNQATSLRWTAPEVLKLGPYTSAADVYSYGVTLYEIATSQVNFFVCFLCPEPRLVVSGALRRLR